MAKITTVAQKEDLVQSPLNDANKVKASDINKIVQTINVNDDLLSEKTEKGGYNGTTQDLKDELNTAVFTGATTYQTEAELLAVSPIPENGTPAKVANDPTSSKNGNYSVVSGAWVQDSSIIDNITVSEDIKTDTDKLLFSDRSKELIPESTDIGSLGYKFIRSDFDFTNIPSGYDNSTWEIKDFFNLGGATINLPTNVTLFFNGGSLKNGNIVGDNTIIKSEVVKIFDIDITLSGTFKDTVSTPQMFGAVGTGDETDILQKVLDFSGDSVIVGNYLAENLQVNLSKIIEIKPNSSIKLNPNVASSSNLIKINADNVVITGYGTLDGNSDNQTFVLDDKHIINIWDSSNIAIKNLNIINASGSFIRGRNCSDISIKNNTFINSKYICIFIGDGDQVNNNINYKNNKMTITDTRNKYVAVKTQADSSVQGATYKNVTFLNSNITRILESGTSTNAVATNSLTDNTKNWVTDEWVGWNVLNITTNAYGEITANTSDTLTVSLSDGSSSLFTLGDVYEISKVNQVGFESKYSQNVLFSNLRVDNCSIGVSSVFGTVQSIIDSVIVNTKSPQGIGVESGSAGQSIISNIMVNGNGSLVDGVLISNDTIITNGNNLVINNVNLIGCRTRALNLTAVLTDGKSSFDKITIQGGVLQSNNIGLFIKNANQVVISDLLIDCGGVMMSLEDTSKATISTIKQDNTINNDIKYTIIRLFSSTSGYVFDDIKISDINLKDGDGGSVGQTILNTSLSNGATLGENIMSTDNSLGYEIIKAISGSTDLTDAVVDVKKFATSPAAGSFPLTSVSDGSTCRVVSSADIGFWVKESGTWVKK